MLKYFFLFLFLSNSSLGSDNKHQRFTYCSNGRCQLGSPYLFHVERQHPLNLNHACKKNHHYALTFDDGPSRNYSKVLEILDEHKIKATFFVMGKNLSSEQSIIYLEAAHEAGHQIANHSFSHPDLRTLSQEKILEEVQTTRKRIIEILGNTANIAEGSRYLRPPFGYIDDRVQDILEQHDFISVRWNADRYDWKLKKAQSDIVVDRVQEQLSYIESFPNHTNLNRSILDLNHDFSQATLAALPVMIPLILAKGYTFVTVKECLQGTLSPS